MKCFFPVLCGADGRWGPDNFMSVYLEIDTKREN